MLHQVSAITNTHLPHPLNLPVQHTPQPVQCIHHRMLHIPHLLYNIHQILEMRNTTSLIAQAHRFIHLLLSHQLVLGMIKYFLLFFSYVNSKIIYFYSYSPTSPTYSPGVESPSYSPSSPNYSPTSPNRSGPDENSN